MGKLSALKEGLEKAVKHLDMSQAARMQRAAEQGVDVERIIYSGTYGDPATEIAGYGKQIPAGDNRFGGIFGSFDEGVAKSHGDKVQRFLSKSHLTDDEFRALSYEDAGLIEDVKRAFKDIKHEDITDDEALELFEYASGEKNIFRSEPEMGRERLEQILSKTDDSEIDWDFQGIKGEIARRKGFTSVGMADEHGESVLVLPGARSTEAAFDPAQKESSNLLASLAPVAVGTGIAALGLNPQETQAAVNRYMQITQPQNAIMQNLENRLGGQMGERGNPITGTMQATPHPMLGKIADVVRTPQAPGIGPLFGGAADYLDKLAQGTPTTYGDRLGAALDIIP